MYLGLWSRIIILLLFTATVLAGVPAKLYQWMHFEQRLIDRTVDETEILPPDVKNQSTRYRPDSGEWFELTSIWVPAAELDVVAVEELIPAELRSELMRDVNGVREYRLFIHPESQQFYSQLMQSHAVTVEHEATATASSRTVLVRSKAHPDKVFFAKLSLDVELGGVRRTIPMGEVARSVGTTLYLRLHREKLSPNFEIIPEVLGIIPKGWPRGGQIIRLVPDAVLRGEMTLIPLFSLYARLAGGTVLEKMIEQARAADPEMTAEEFVRQKLVRPFLATWADWAVKGAVVMEAHAQNVLLEVDATGRPTGRFVHRDLGGFNIDGAAPTADAAAIARLPAISDFHKDYHQAFSAQARSESLFTFFQGGFLFNVDRELRRIDPSYKAGSLKSEFSQEVAAAIANVSGLPLKKIQVATLRESIAETLHLAQKAAKMASCEAPLTKVSWWHRLLPR